MKWKLLNNGFFIFFIFFIIVLLSKSNTIHHLAHWDDVENVMVPVCYYKENPINTFYVYDLAHPQLSNHLAVVFLNITGFTIENLHLFFYLLGTFIMFYAFKIVSLLTNDRYLGVLAALMIFGSPIFFSLIGTLNTIVYVAVFSLGGLYYYIRGNKWLFIIFSIFSTHSKETGIFFAGSIFLIELFFIIRRNNENRFSLRLNLAFIALNALSYIAHLFVRMRYFSAMHAPKISKGLFTSLVAFHHEVQFLVAVNPFDFSKVYIKLVEIFKFPLLYALPLVIFGLFLAFAKLFKHFKPKNKLKLGFFPRKYSTSFTTILVSALLLLITTTFMLFFFYPDFYPRHAFAVILFIYIALFLLVSRNNKLIITLLILIMFCVSGAIQYYYYNTPSSNACWSEMGPGRIRQSDNLLELISYLNSTDKIESVYASVPLTWQLESCFVDLDIIANGFAMRGQGPSCPRYDNRTFFEKNYLIFPTWNTNKPSLEKLIQVYNYTLIKKIGNNYVDSYFILYLE
jgi:hypothetical protein